MIVWRWNRVDGKLWKENFFECLVGRGGRKINDRVQIFSSRAHQNGKKIEWERIFSKLTKIPCTHCASCLYFLFFSTGQYVVLSFFFSILFVSFDFCLFFSFLFFSWQYHCLFLFWDIIIFLFFNKFGWFLFFFVIICHFFVLIKHHSLTMIYE